MKLLCLMEIRYFISGLNNNAAIVVSKDEKRLEGREVEEKILHMHYALTLLHASFFINNKRAVRKTWLHCGMG